MRRSRRSSRGLPTPSCRNSTVLLVADPVASPAVLMASRALVVHRAVSLVLEVSLAVEVRRVPVWRKSTKSSRRISSLLHFTFALGLDEHISK